MSDEIADLERQIMELSMRLAELRKQHSGAEVPNYTFRTLTGKTSLLDLFGTHDTQLVIHNMGQGCRYCTLWADGLNGFVPHLETALAVTLVSRDPPDVQRRLANARGWRFRMASHDGGPYIREQTVVAGEDNAPGAVVYQREGDVIRRRNACVFGPGDLYCPIWHLLGMAGLDAGSWTPQYSYWRRPKKMDDGGANLPD